MSDELAYKILDTIEEHHAQYIEIFARQDKRFEEQDKRFAMQDKRFEEQDKKFAIQDKRFEEQDKKFAIQDKRFEEQDKKFAIQDKRFEEQDKRFAEQDKRFEEQDKRFAEQDKRFEEQDKRFAEQDKRLDGHDKKLDKHEKMLNELIQISKEHTEDIKSIKRSLVLIEDAVNNKIPALFDAFMVSQQKDAEMSNDIKKLERIANFHSLKISILEDTSKKHSERLAKLSS